MSEKIRDMKRRIILAQRQAFATKRRLQLCDMADAHRMAIEGHGWEDIRWATKLPTERCREIVFGRAAA